MNDPAQPSHPSPPANKNDAADSGKTAGALAQRPGRLERGFYADTVAAVNRLAALWEQQGGAVNVAALRRATDELQEKLDLLAGTTKARSATADKPSKVGGLGVYHPGGPPEKFPDAKTKGSLKSVPDEWIRKKLTDAKTELASVEAQLDAATAEESTKPFDKESFSKHLTKLREAVEATAHPPVDAKPKPGK